MPKGSHGGATAYFLQTELLLDRNWLCWNEVYRTTYAVHAFAVHLGESPTSGHYRALLYDDVSGELHYCGDHIKPILLHDFETVSSDVYVIVLSKQQDL